MATSFLRGRLGTCRASVAVPNGRKIDGRRRRKRNKKMKKKKKSRRIGVERKNEEGKMKKEIMKRGRLLEPEIALR